MPPNLNSSSTAPVSQSHLGYLDALRGYAIAGVFLTHSMHEYGVELPKALNVLRSGVTLFYVLSAFCLMLSLERRSGNSVNWNAYWIKRFFRIAPLFYFAIIVWSLIHLGEGRSLDPVKITTSVLFINGFFPAHIHSAVPHGWSIAVETSFYAILPALFLTITTLRRSLIVLAAAIPACVLLSWLLPQLVFSTTGNGVDIRQYTVYWLPAQLPAFLLGISAFHVVYGKCDLSGSIRRFFETKWLPWMAFAIPLTLTCIVPTRLVAVSSAAAAVCLIIILSTRSLSILINQPAIRIGLISFGLYLFHQLGLNLTGMIEADLLRQMPSAIAISGSAALSIIIATITYRLIEVPGMRYGGMLAKKKISASMTRT